MINPAISSAVSLFVHLFYSLAVLYSNHKTIEIHARTRTHMHENATINDYINTDD